MRIEYTKDYEIGIEQIDAEHRQFFEYINAAMAALDEPEETGIVIAKNLLLKLAAYAATHFEHEEEHMKKMNDAQLFPQIRAHQAFRDRLGELTSKGELTQRDLGDIFIFMAKWLRTHILTSDMLIGAEHSKGRFEMTEDFMTGIELIDAEHATLFSIIKRVHDTIENDMLHDRFDAISDILSELRDYTVRHFADEEEYMERVGYAGLAGQKAAHEAFIDKVGEIDLLAVSEMGDRQKEYLNGLVEFLNDWLINHILKMDKKIPAQ